MEKERIVKTIVLVVVVIVVIVAVFGFYRMKAKQYAEEQQRIEMQMKSTRK